MGLNKVQYFIRSYILFSSVFTRIIRIYDKNNVKIDNVEELDTYITKVYSNLFAYIKVFSSDIQKNRINRKLMIAN